MHKGALSRWLLLSVIADTFLVGSRFWHTASQVVPLAPYRRGADWAREPDLLVLAVLFLGGFVAIVMALDGDRRPLFFWNVCYLAVIVAANFSVKMSIASFISRFTVQRSILMGTAMIAAIALCIEQTQNAAGGPPGLNS
jgi:hypothetical protein